MTPFKHNLTSTLRLLEMILSMVPIIRGRKTLLEHSTLAHYFWYWFKVAVQKLFTEQVNYVLPNSSYALLCKLQTLRNWHFALLYSVILLHRKTSNWLLADHVWNRPIMHCKPLITDYVTSAYGMFSCDVRILHSNIWWPKNCIWRLVFTNRYLLTPSLKNLVSEKVCRGHFAAQLKFSGWNTETGAGI